MGGRADSDTYFLRIASVVATRATCDRRHVGVVLVRDHRVLTTGYNGAPAGMDSCDEVGHQMADVMGKERCVRTTHAELNAVVDAARRGIPIDGATMYATHGPCHPGFAGETEIVTWDGIFALRDLAGDRAKVLTKDGRVPRWLEAEVRSFGVQPLMRVVLKRDMREKVVYATPDHRWFVVGRWRPNYPVVRHPEIAKATGGLSPGDVLPSVYAHPTVMGGKQGVRLSSVGIQHGFSFGDGTLPSRTRSALRANFFGEKGAAMLKWFSPMAHTTVGAVAGEAMVVGGRPITRVVSSLVVHDLPRYFKRPPSLTESRSYLLGWLAGYFAADGSVNRAGTPTLSSADRSNLVFAELVCMRLGIRTRRIDMQMRIGAGRLASPLYRLPFPKGALPKEFFLLGSHRLAAEPRQKAEGTWPVASVEPTKRVEEVICATVPETGNFTLEGNVATGNCSKTGDRSSKSFVGVN